MRRVERKVFLQSQRAKKVGVLIEKEEGKKSIQLDQMQISKDWDGGLVVAERKEKEEYSKESEGGDLEPF